MKHLGKLTASWSPKYEPEKDKIKGELRSIRDVLRSMMVCSQIVVSFATLLVQADPHAAFADYLLFLTDLSYQAHLHIH